MTRIDPSAPVATADDRPRLAVAATPGTPLPLVSFALPAIKVARLVSPRGPSGVGSAEDTEVTGARDETTGADVGATTGGGLVVGAAGGELALLGALLAAATGGVGAVCERCATTTTTTSAAATAAALAAAMTGFVFTTPFR